jgi:Zn-dependent protease
MLLTFWELFDMIATIAFVGFIFSDMFPRKQKDIFDIRPRFDIESIKYAAMITAPGLILHELSHKFLALSFGMSATYHAAYIPWFVIGILLKLANFNFIFVVPAFVSITGGSSPLEYSAVAFAGPCMNLLLWLGIAHALKNKMIPKNRQEMFFFAKEINKILFIFNMIPIPGFDGYKVLAGILQASGVSLPF